MAKVHTKWLDKSIKILVAKAEKKGLAVGSNLIGDIKQEAKKGGYLRGVHVLSLTNKDGIAGFKVKKSKPKKERVSRQTSLSDKPTRKMVAFRLPGSLIEEWGEMSRQMDVNKTDLIEKALRRYLKHLEKR